MVTALDGQRLQLREEAEHAGRPLGRVDRDMSNAGPPAIHLKNAWLLGQRGPPGVAPRVPQPVPLSPVRIALDCITEPGAQLGAVEVVQIRPQIAEPGHRLEVAGAQFEYDDPGRQHVEDVLRGARVFGDVDLGQLEVADQQDGAPRHPQCTVELVELALEKCLRDVRLRVPVEFFETVVGHIAVPTEAQVERLIERSSGKFIENPTDTGECAQQTVLAQETAPAVVQQLEHQEPDLGRESRRGQGQQQLAERN